MASKGNETPLLSIAAYQMFAAGIGPTADSADIRET
jgi:hypothetical protein